MSEKYKVDIKILWTGGWDSTYRMVELSKTSYTIQPIYVYGDGRLSEKNEIKAMKKILNNLKKHNNNKTKANFLPIKFIKKSEIPKNSEITKAYYKICESSNLGTQHEWLARLAYIYPGLEIGTEKAPIEVSNILTAINLNGKLIKSYNGEGYILDPDNSTKEGKLIFGNFVFPIIDKTGVDMKRNIEEWGYKDIMKDVWVCHGPIFNKPCGFCHPCELKIETGMEFVLSETALKRYIKVKKSRFHEYYYKTIRKLSNIVS